MVGTFSNSKVMDQSRTQLLKRAANAIALLVLFAFLMVFYFINETDKFWKGSTTFASRTEIAEKISIPVVVICFEPAYKPSVNGNYSVNFDHIFEIVVIQKYWQVKAKWQRIYFG